MVLVVKLYLCVLETCIWCGRNKITVDSVLWTVELFNVSLLSKTYLAVIF